MEITLKISDNWLELLKIAGGFLIFCLITYYGSKYYIDRQKRDAEEGQRRIDEMNHSSAQDDDSQE